MKNVFLLILSLLPISNALVAQASQQSFCNSISEVIETPLFKVSFGDIIENDTLIKFYEEKSILSLTECNNKNICVVETKDKQSIHVNSTYKFDHRLISIEFYSTTNGSSLILYYELENDLMKLMAYRMGDY